MVREREGGKEAHPATAAAARDPTHTHTHTNHAAAPPPPLLVAMLTLLMASAVGGAARRAPQPPRRALREFSLSHRSLLADERLANSLTLAAGIVGPFFDPAGNLLGIAGSAVPALRSAGVPLPGCTACPVSPAAAGPLKMRTRTINNLIIGANDIAQTVQPGGVRGATTRFFRSGGQTAG